MVGESSTPKRNDQRIRCPHCENMISPRTFRNHKALYYNNLTHTWERKIASPDPAFSCPRAQSCSDESSSSDEDELDISGIHPLDTSHSSDHGSPTLPQCSDGRTALRESNATFDTGADSEGDEDNIITRPNGASDYSEGSDEFNEEEGEDHGTEMWEGVTAEEVETDLMIDAVPHGTAKQSVCTKHGKVIMWFLQFLLMWQTLNFLSDNGLSYLLKSLYILLDVLGVDKTLIHGFISLYMMRKVLSLERDDFTKYAVCPSCTKLYQMYDIVETRLNRKFVVNCNNILQKGRREVRCGTPLSREVTLGSGTKHFYPFKTYCVKSIINSLESLLQRPGIAEKCEEWRDIPHLEGEYADIYDGSVWRRLTEEREGLLCNNGTLALMMNIDWFQPFKRRSDVSIGVIYFVVLNLPRSERFKRENVILAGVIPSLHKIPHSLNYFLEPIVEELRVLYEGVSMNTPLNSDNQGGTQRKTKAVLVCVAADIPAARKVCGFLSHSATKGCNRCNKTFPGNFGSRDYSGFERNLWPMRTNVGHRRKVEEIKTALTETDRIIVEKRYGIRYTKLLELPYYDAVKFCVVDPMHNLFLGTAKKVFQIWIDNGTLTKSKLEQLDDVVGSVKVPSDLGRLPGRISSNYNSFKACQWKVWTLTYSMYCLKGLIPNEELNCWEYFVLGCRAMCKPLLTLEDVSFADAALMTFCRRFELLYGRGKVTPNMHLHGHLHECIRDYGPPHVFWLFSFERYNGIMGKFHTNYRSIEMQLMRKFLSMKNAFEMGSSLLECSTFIGNVSKMLDSDENNDEFPSKYRNIFRMSSDEDLNLLEWGDLTGVSFPNSSRLLALSEVEKNALKEMYKKLYPNAENITPNEIYQKYAHVTYLKRTYNIRSKNHILARWTTEDGTISARETPRPGRIKYFLKHCVKVDGENISHVLCVIVWYKRHETEHELYGKVSKAWHYFNHVPFGPSSFMPVQRIFDKCAFVRRPLGGTESIVILPMNKFVFG